MTIVVMGLVLGGIIIFSEKEKENRANQVATVSLRFGEPLTDVKEVGVSIGSDFENYKVERITDTLVENVKVGTGNPSVRIRYHYENGNFLEIKVLDKFINQGLSGTNCFQLFQDSIGYDYHP